MKNVFWRLVLVGSLGWALVGCESAPRNARYVDPEGRRTIVSLEQIDIQDWNNAADRLVASLVRSGVLDRAPSLPSVMAVSRVRNNTQQQVDTDSLTKKIRIGLNQTGKVVTTTTVGPDGRVEDDLALELGAMQAGMTGPRPILTMPHYTLSGKLLEDRARAGNTRQVTYTFQLSLTTVSDGLAVWEAEEQITKQGSRSAVGW